MIHFDPVMFSTMNDIYSCDQCMGPTFPGAREFFKSNDIHVGQMRVLCTHCAEDYELQIVPKGTQVPQLSLAPEYPDPDRWILPEGPAYPYSLAKRQHLGAGLM